MSFLRNMKIRGKLFLGFFLVLAITVFIAVFGIVNINTINTNYVLMQDFPSARYDILNHMATDIMDLRRIVTAMAFRLGDGPALNELRAEALQARTSLDQLINSHQASLRADIMISLARQVENINESNDLRAVLHRYSDEVLEGMFAAARDGIPGDPESRARIDIYLDLGGEVYSEIDASFTTLREGAQTTMNNRHLEIQATTANTMVIMIILTIVGVFLGLLIAMMISGMVTKPIGLLTTALSDVANGDLTKRLPENSNDEVGQASRSYNQSMDEFSKMISSVKNQAGVLSDIGNDLASNMTETDRKSVV